MLSGQVTTTQSAEPILKAVEAYRGAIIDLDHGHIVGPAAFARGWADLAAEMALAGLHVGDRVVVAISNGPLYVATWAAIISRGGSPLLVHSKTPVEELKRTALRFGAAFVVTDGCDEAEMQATIASTKTISDDAWIRLVWAAIDTCDPVFQSQYPSLPGVPLHPTSGTTGIPKIAVRPATCAVAEAAHYIETIGVEASDIIMAVAPMSHAYGYGMSMMVPLLSGADIATMRKFSPKLVHKALRDFGVTILPAVPAMLDVLLFGAGDIFQRTRCLLTAGAPLPEKTAQNFASKTGVTVRPLYGTTETGGITVMTAAAGMQSGICVGLPMNGVAAQVQDRLGNAEWGAGVGRLHIRSTSMMAGYLSPTGIDTTPLVDGWFDTGDLARIDDLGAIHLKGRETEVINVMGMKVIPSEVEEVIATIPEVVEAKVYSGLHRSGTQFVKVAVVANSALDVPGIRAHCEKHLVYYKRPEVITFLEALPRSPAGKIVRDQLP